MAKHIGRPKTDDPRVILNFIRLERSKIEKMQGIADSFGIHITDAYAEAIDHYIKEFDRINRFTIRL